MRIAIVGATGSVGAHLVNQSLHVGHDVVAVVRDPAKIDQQHDHLHVVVADVTDDDDRLRTAVADCDAVVVALGDGMRGRVRAVGTRNVVSAMKDTGVSRLICQSTLGAGDSFGNLNWLWKFIFRVPLRKAMADHVEQEELVRASGLDWTIVRPAAFTDGDHTGRYRHGFDSLAKNLTLKISRADVADFIVRQISGHDYLHQAAALSY
ncbi:MULTISPECIES: NAD(P)-dependent oxidoreductase [Crateriforma]|uniref:NAD(P)-binding domain-containing protein n=1 Tax=Crateriforma conspicua TaxID=2527996 RepID=A0A5C6FNG7_9PLAN|nr:MULTISPECIES: SDR family oxidoreductase [Crateriforma]TWU62188.1 hypothetical protein V7x_39170 [Crateriforma conspicua]